MCTADFWRKCTSVICNYQLGKQLFYVFTLFNFTLSFAVDGPIMVVFKIPVSELSKIDDQRSVSILKINLPKHRFIESLHRTAILKNLIFLQQFSKKQNMTKKNMSWTEIKSLLTKPSNVLSFYTSSQNSNLLYSEVDSLKT